jgi:hypothetical protein
MIDLFADSSGRQPMPQKKLTSERSAEFYQIAAVSPQHIPAKPKFAP